MFEIGVKEKHAIGVGMYPVTVGKVQSAMEQRNTTCALEIKHVFAIKYNVPKN